MPKMWIHQTGIWTQTPPKRNIIEYTKQLLYHCAIIIWPRGNENPKSTKKLSHKIVLHIMISYQLAVLSKKVIKAFLSIVEGVFSTSDHISSCCSELGCIRQYSGNLDYFTGLKLTFVVTKFAQKVRVKYIDGSRAAYRISLNYRGSQMYR